jgi:hypothetical protein
MIRFVLDRATGDLHEEDFIVISALTEKFHPVAHIRHGELHVLVGIPQEYHQEAIEIIQSLNYECRVFSATECELCTFVIRKRDERKPHFTFL